MTTSLSVLSKGLEAAIAQAKDSLSELDFDDLLQWDDSDTYKCLTSLRAAIERAAGDNSVYAKQVKSILGDHNIIGFKVQSITGVAESLKSDLDAGYISSLTQLVHADLFESFLEMAEHLLESGYKDAAAVISGSSLEQHLRQLCVLHGIDTNDPHGKPKKADLLNADIAKQGCYNKLDQKNVTGWLDLRNKAAHGLYSEYSKEQVALHIASIREFIARLPA